MKFHQPGQYSERVTRAQIDDWTWARTVRRVSVLVRLAAPYRLRVAGGTAALLVGTAEELRRTSAVYAEIEEHGLLQNGAARIPEEVTA